MKDMNEKYESASREPDGRTKRRRYDSFRALSYYTLGIKAQEGRFQDLPFWAIFMSGGFMKKTYTGKTKDLYLLEDGKVCLKFKDDVTGKDGVFDPGENQVGLSIDGMGMANLQVTDFFLDALEADGIETHRIKTDLDQGSMLVQACQPFGQGLEVIFRHYATGSFLRRYGLYAKDMMPLDNYVEFTLKDDERQDPLITKEGLIALGILTADEYDYLYEKTIEISNKITDILKNKDIQLIDIKLEFGKNQAGDILLMDELSVGNMRVRVDGQSLEPLKVSQLILA